MIDTNELRLGNWIYVGEINKLPMQVEIISKDYVYLKSEETAVNCNDKQLYAIPLTESFIKSLEFEEIGGDYIIQHIAENYNYYIYFHVNIETTATTISLFTYDDSYEDYLCEDIRYVHQLQNIIFALTGEELEIKREWL